MNRGGKKNRMKAGEGLRLYFIDLVLLALSWGGYYRSLLANSDTLWAALNPAAPLNSDLGNFRWGAALVESILTYRLGWIPYRHQKISILLFIAFLSLALFLLQKTFIPLFSLKTKSAHILFIAAASLCFVNVLFAEYFYFTESFPKFVFSFLLCTCGCLLIQRGHRVWGIILLLLTPAFYQMGCVYAALILMTVVFIEEKGRLSGKLVLRELSWIMVCALSGLLNYASGPYLLKLVPGLNIPWYDGNYEIAKRVTVEMTPSNADFLFSELKLLYSSSLGLMPGAYLPLLFSAAITLGVIILLIAGRKGRELAAYLLYCAAGFVTACGPGIISAGSGDLIPRTICPFFWYQGMNALTAMYFAEACGIRKVRWDRAFAGVTAVYLAAQVFFIQIIIANRILSENLDILYADAIIKEVEKHEEESGEKIEKIFFCNDPNAPSVYPQVYYHRTAVNMRLLGTSSYTLVETVAKEKGRHFEMVDADEKEEIRVQKELFEEKNWNSFDPDEQIKFIGDTVYVSVF